MGFFDFVQKLEQERPVVICGDLNVTRSTMDIYPENTQLMGAEASYMPKERAAGLFLCVRVPCPESRKNRITQMSMHLEMNDNGCESI